MSTARIDLSSGTNCIQQNGIDRNKPAILDNHMSNADWQKFCDDVDKAIKPLNTLTTVFLIIFVLLVLSIVIVFVSFFINVSSDPWADDSSGPPKIIFIIPAVLFCLMIVMIVISCITFNKAKAQIQEVLSTASQKQPRLSFHLRYERHYYRSGGSTTSHTTQYHTTQYIDVSINNETQPSVSTGSPDYPVVGFSSAQPYNPITASKAPSSEAGPAYRLEELEKIKHLLSPQEYEAKRADIIHGL